MAELNITMPRGDIRNIKFCVRDGEQPKTDFTEIYFTVKKTAQMTDVLFQKKLSDGTITPAGSNAAVKLTAAQSGMPSHSHGPSINGEKLLSTSSSGEGVSRRTQASGSGATNTLFSSYAVNRITTTDSKSASASESHNHTFTGTKATIHTLPKYKSVYIWERVS